MRVFIPPRPLQLYRSPHLTTISIPARARPLFIYSMDNSFGFVPVLTPLERSGWQSRTMPTRRACYVASKLLLSKNKEALIFEMALKFAGVMMSILLERMGHFCL
jgi:hypothetical protein